MRKQVFGRQFKRDRNERKALFKALVSSLVLDERINTTEEKAKAIKGLADKIVNRVKKNGSIYNLATYISPIAFRKLYLDIVPRFGKKQGGYTRILKTGRRVSDNASMVLMEWTENSSKLKVQNSKLEAKERKNPQPVKKMRKNSSKTVVAKKRKEK